MKSFNAVVLFLMFFAIGYSFVGVPAGTYIKNRDPAAVNTAVIDMSVKSGLDLHNAIREKLLGSLQVKRVSSQAGVALGHFYLKNKGEDKAACVLYPTVSLTFFAEGISVAGNKPMMEVEGRCELTSDNSGINPLMIPVDQILSEAPGDGEFQFRQGQKLTVKFANLPEGWPKKWILNSIKLNNVQTKETYILENSEIQKQRGSPVILNF